MHGLGLPSDNRKGTFVDDAAVERDAIHLVGLAVVSDLHHQNFHLQRLQFLAENGTEALRVAVRKRTGGHIFPAVHESLEICVPDAGLPEIFKFAVLAGPRKGDAVVDLGDFIQRGAGIFRDEQYPVHIFNGDDGAAFGDAFLGILRLVLHHLLGRDVIGHRHA